MSAVYRKWKAQQDGGVVDDAPVYQQLDSASTAAIRTTGALAPPQSEAAKENSRVVKYASPLPLYASAWSRKGTNRLRLAVGSISEGNENKVTLLEFNEEYHMLMETLSMDTRFPANGISFIPDMNNNFPDLVAVCTDSLRIHSVEYGKGFHEECVVSHDRMKNTGITSFDWNVTDPRIIAIGALDSTCTLFSVEVGKATSSTRTANVKTALLASNGAVHDVEFSGLSGGTNIFATVGSDGQCMMFDARNLSQSSILYEEPRRTPLSRVSWNKRNPHLVATFAQEGHSVYILDVRYPEKTLLTLKGHGDCVNSLAWAPNAPHSICTVGDDYRALIWDISYLTRERTLHVPKMHFNAGGEISQVNWSSANPEWLNIVHDNMLEIIRI